jgi:hypothetical protein
MDQLLLAKPEIIPVTLTAIVNDSEDFETITDDQIVLADSQM